MDKKETVPYDKVKQNLWKNAGPSEAVLSSNMGKLFELITILFKSKESPQPWLDYTTTTASLNKPSSCYLR